MIPTVVVIREELHVALPAHAHERIRLPLLIRSLLDLSPILLRMIAVRGGLLRHPVHLLTMHHPFAIDILLKDLHRHGVVLVFNHSANLDIIDTAEQRAFAPHLTFGEIELVHGASEAIGAVRGVQSALGDPGVLETSVDGDTAVDIDSEHAVNKIKSWIANAVPVWRGIVEAAHFDLLGEVEGVFGRVELIGEGREAAKADVEDYAKGPYIDRTGIFAVFAVLKDFRRDICRKIRMTARNIVQDRGSYSWVYRIAWM